MPAIIIKNLIIKTYYLKIAYVFLILMLIFETGHYFIFNTKFTPSSIFIVSETNLTEAKEFLLFYLDFKLFVLLSVLITLTIYSLIKIQKWDIKIFHTNKKISTILLFTFFSSLLLLLNHTRRQNLLFLMVKSYYDLNRDSYFNNSEVYGHVFGPFENKGVNKADSEETFIVVIGESTTKQNLNLYGYERNTTPLLNKVKGELLIYKNVISANASTTKALKKAFTINTNEAEGSIIQLINNSGFTTYWLSNQNPIGFHESLVSKIAKASSKRVFLTAANSEENKIYDHHLLKELDKALNDNKKHKVIFIHLQGTHLNYYNRYPETYSFFNDIPPGSKYSSDKIHKIINTYDNAILYNDFVLSSIIEKVKEKKTSSSVLYFSDHGEEVYNTIKFVGHSDDVGTLPMFQIPFLLWQSEDRRLNNSIEVDLDRPYMTDDLFHSIAHLCGINNEYVNLEKSIFSKTFQNRKRIILNNKDYDSILAIKRNNN
ncbi:phosphoethanolamine transferase [Jejuia spongiicola]|uniref:Phosphoethanolamine transferase n=1 Tax=Jejuia spongiicola TaxID=2942207 RepID=A0ABT0QHS9_9FLAO|nr:phosphoethanolamine transferase [Jejuia spongiicola]MCL6296546.1 phosphoethanolamine transferase [Jejuia spongiicola]